MDERIAFCLILIVVTAGVVAGIVGCGGRADKPAAQPTSSSTTVAQPRVHGTTSTSAATRKPVCNSDTCFYLGKKELGYIDSSIFDCPAYSAGYVTGGRRSLAVHTHTSTEGYAVLRPSGRWDIYAHTYTVRGGFFWKHVGYALRRTRTRWDVLRFGPKREHVVGHTIGSQGPAAATLLLTICWEG